MFARSCPRMGVRFASGNVFYMNKTFSARHLQSVASPLSTGFITPVRFTSVSAAGCGGALQSPIGVGELGAGEVGELVRADGVQLDSVLENFILPTYTHIGSVMSRGMQLSVGSNMVLNIRSWSPPPRAVI